MQAAKRAYRRFKDWRIGRLPARRFLHDTVIPALAALGRRRVLFVGTRSYNSAAYARCEECGLRVWSIDLDPLAAPHGAPAGHFVGSICDVDRLASGHTFDAIILNGVLGWGVNTRPEALKALAAIRNVSGADALIFVGWNPGMTSGDEVAAVRERLRPVSAGAIPATIEFPAAGAAQRYPHRYELFTFG